MIQIKRNNKVFFTLEDFGEGSKLSYQLMDHHYIILKFTTANPIYFEIGDSVEIPDFGYFELTSSYFPKHNDSDGYDYEMQMDAYYMSWKNKICKYRPQHGANETSFNLTTTVGVHMNVILGNLKALGLTYNGKDFSVDYTTYNNKAFDVQKRFLIEYGSISILDALNAICSEDALNCEWWIDGSIIYLGYCEMEGQTTFEQDVNVLSMSYSESKSTYITRLYAFGSDRNIPKGYFTGADADVTTDGVATDYLMLPNKEVDSDGFYAKDGYLENVNVVKNDKQAIEGVVMFDDEYPKVESSVSSIKTYDSTVDNEDGTKTTQTFWQVTSTDSFTNSFKESWIKSNLTLGIKFTSGALMGMEFDVSFKVIDKVNYFEIVANDTYGRTLPDGVMCPRVGDKYFLFNWDATKITDTDLIPTAQLSLFDRAKQYYLKTMISNSNFTCTMDGDKFYNDGTYDYHPLGEQVKLINDMFAQVDADGKHYRNSRIIGMEIPLDIPYDHPQYTVGEKAATSRLGKLEDKVDSIKVNGMQINGGNGGGGVYVIGMNDSTPPTDSNVLSARKSINSFVSKLFDDVAKGLITFEQGIQGIKSGAEALWKITLDGAAYLKELFIDGNVEVKGNTKLGLNGTNTEFGVYNTDSTGARIQVKEDGTSIAEFDYITIRRAAQFRDITIRELRHIGGELAITPAAMVCSKVERLNSKGEVIAKGDNTEPSSFKCYFETKDSDEGSTKVFNYFRPLDQARCQQFDIVADGSKKTRYYWRLVMSVGENYIVLSNLANGGMDSLTTSEPLVGDNIVQLGYQGSDDPNRQSAIILSSTSDDAPSQKMYQGISSFSLDGCLVKDEGYDAATGVFHCNIYGDSFIGGKDSYFTYDSKQKKATFKGTVNFESDSTLPDGSSVNDIAKKDDLQDLNIKSGNLLRNTSFCGDYESIDISEDTEISEDKETFSEKLKYWTMENASVIDTKDSTSGKAVRIGGTLSQQLAQPLLPGKAYVLSFKGKGTTVKVSIGGETHDVDMTSSFERYELHITCSDAADDVFSMVSMNCTVCEIMLSYGKLAPAWSPSYSDNDKSMAEFQNMKFLTDAITQGSTTIDGGLVMSQQFKVGNFRDKKMIKETGGMSGYYNDDDSPFLWGGGTLEQAIYTIQKYKDNPNYEPTAEELNNLAKFVVTHGGRAILTDIILRGIIYAEGGVMKSIKSPNGNFEIDEKGNAKLKGHIEAGDGKIGGFDINRDSLFHGDPSKWATTDNENISQVGWNFIRIAQAITYVNRPIAYQKIGIGGNANPNDKEDSDSIGSTALYIYRKMLAYTPEKAYKPAAIIESRNVQNRNIALRLIGGLQIYGGVIQHGRVMTYTKEGDTNELNLSFGTMFTLRNASADSMDFFFPSLPEARNQLGITDADEEFCIPVTVVAAAGTTKFAISTQLAAQDTSYTEADGGRFVDNNGTWDYGNDKHYGGNRIAMENGDSWSFSLTFTKAQGYYIQILNRQV